MTAFGQSPPRSRMAVDGLCVARRGSQAPILRQVSLAVTAGSVLGVVGESGSGKTTLGLAMIGHVRRGLQITTGTARFEGSDLLRMRAADLRRLRGADVAYVPQDPSMALNPARKVGGQLLEVLLAHGWSRTHATERASEVLDEVGLGESTELLGRYPHQLSGGQQQRIAIAIAFACSPSFILLDEPTTGLDVTTQRTVLNTIERVCSSYGVAAVYVSHDVAAVALLADTVAVMQHGEVVECGTTADVLGAPAHPYTRALLSAVPSGVEPVAPDPQSALVASTTVNARDDRRSPAVPRWDAAERISPSSTDALLAVRGLRADYHGTEVLSEVSLRVHDRRSVAVVGESGSGKTTLARCIAGLHRSWSGSIEYAGSPLPSGVAGRPRELLRNLQYVFQNPYGSLNPRRTVGSTLSQQLDQFGARRDERTDDAVVDLLEAVELPADYIGRFPDQLSGGERQRVAIARALAGAPRLMICDEVTAALDVSVQAAVVSLLQGLQGGRGLTLLFITHNLLLVPEVAEEIVVVEAGRVVESGLVSDVLARPQHPYTQKLMADVLRLR
jgi:peptide/nickel transport system ATP-binding protein